MNDRFIERFAPLDVDHCAMHDLMPSEPDITIVDLGTSKMLILGIDPTAASGISVQVHLSRESARTLMTLLGNALDPPE